MNKRPTPMHDPRNHVKAWRLKNGKINFKIIADNGKPLVNSANQQFSRRAGFINSIISLAQTFKSAGVVLPIKWTKSARSLVVIKEEELKING